MSRAVVLLLEVVGIVGGAVAVVLASCRPSAFRGGGRPWTDHPVIATLLGRGPVLPAAVSRPVPGHSRRPHAHRRRRRPVQPGPSLHLLGAPGPETRATTTPPR